MKAFDTLWLQDWQAPETGGYSGQYASWDGGAGQSGQYPPPDAGQALYAGQQYGGQQSYSGQPAAYAAPAPQAQQGYASWDAGSQGGGRYAAAPGQQPAGGYAPASSQQGGYGQPPPAQGAYGQGAYGAPPAQGQHYQVRLALSVMCPLQLQAPNAAMCMSAT